MLIACLAILVADLCVAQSWRERKVWQLIALCDYIQSLSSSRLLPRSTRTAVKFRVSGFRIVAPILYLASALLYDVTSLL